MDIGPPFNYYDLFVVKETGAGSLVDKISITPAGDKCTQSVEVRDESRSSKDSIAQVLGGRDLCSIPEKELRKERKRCKKCLVFSGEILNLQIPCGGTMRVIRADILDRDIFGQNVGTPTHTRWTMELMERLDKLFPSNAWNSPVFVGEEKNNGANHDVNPIVAANLRAGKYDPLFAGSPDKISALYQVAENAPAYAGPTVRLVERPSLISIEESLPVYPPIAKAAHVFGNVKAHFSVDAEGNAEKIAIDEGPPLLRGSVEQAVQKWKFEPSEAKDRVDIEFEFDLNCLGDKPTANPAGS